MPRLLFFDAFLIGLPSRLRGLNYDFLAMLARRFIRLFDFTVATLVFTALPISLLIAPNLLLIMF